MPAHFYNSRGEANSPTAKMLDYLNAYGLVVGDLEEIAKKIPHQEKMVLLRFYANMRDTSGAMKEVYRQRLEAKAWDVRLKYIEPQIESPEVSPDTF